MNKDLNSGGETLIRKLKNISKDLKFIIPPNKYERHKNKIKEKENSKRGSV